MIKVVCKSYPYLLNGHVCLMYNEKHEEQNVSPYAFVNVSVYLDMKPTLFNNKEEAEAALAIRNEWYNEKWNVGAVEFVEVV